MLLGPSLLAALVACSAPPTPQDSHAAARRVVSLAPAITAILVELGVADRLVGVTRYCTLPPGTSVPVVGDLEPRPEAIMATEPDLVVMARYGSQGGAEQKLAALGLNVRAWPLDSIQEMRDATVDLARHTDSLPRARALLAALDAAEARAREAARARRSLKVLLVYDVQPGFVLTTGGGDHLFELLAWAGAVNIAGPGPVTMRLGLEEVIARAPDVILHAAADQRFPDDAAARAYWKAFPDLPAVQRGHVYVWPDDTLARNGPHLAGVVDRLVALLATP